MLKRVVEKARFHLKTGPIRQLAYAVPFSYELRKYSLMACGHMARGRYRHFDPNSKLFTVIEIQTKTGCNYSCPFCPQNKEGIELPKGTMEIELYERIISELSALEFSGTIGFGGMDEPLLDERLVEFVSIARKQCPEATIGVTTNGSLLNKDLIEALVNAGANLITVNDYTKRQVITQDIKNMKLSNVYRKRLSIFKRSFSEKATNRAGNVLGGKIPPSPPRLFCTRPFRRMYISYNGKAVICCQDYKQEEIMGDASESSLLEIWCNEKCASLRTQLLGLNRAGFICERCDFAGFEF